MSGKKGGVNNLKVPTSEEARRNGKKGGLKSAKVRAERKKAKEAMNELLKLNVAGEKNREFLTKMGIKEEDQQNIMLLVARLYMKAAATGDPSAVRTVLEIAGDTNIQTEETHNPTININVSPATVNDIDDF